MKNAEVGPIVNPPAYETIEAPTCNPVAQSQMSN